MKDWPQVTKEVAGQMKNFRADAREVINAFSSLAPAAAAAKALDAKTKELIALVIAVAVGCGDCIAFYVKAALGEGSAVSIKRSSADRRRGPSGPVRAGCGRPSCP